MNTGDKIKALRLKNKMTLEELGNRVGVGKSTVRKWEAGAIKNMGRDKVARLAKAFNVSPTYLITDDGDIGRFTFPDNWMQFFAGGAPEDEQHKLLIQLFDQLPASSQELIIAQLKGAVQSQKAQDDQ